MRTVPRRTRRPLNTDDSFGRPPGRLQGSTKAAQTLLPQLLSPPHCSISSHRWWGCCSLSAPSTSGILSLLQDDMPFDGEVRRSTALDRAPWPRRMGYNDQCDRRHPTAVMQAVRIDVVRAMVGTLTRSSFTYHQGYHRLRCLLRVRPHRAWWHDRMGRPETGSAPDVITVADRYCCSILARS